jgi:serine/threonine protein kinase
MLRTLSIASPTRGSYGKKFSPVHSDGEDSPLKTERVVSVPKRIEALVGTLTDRYVILGQIYDRGNQCRIKRVKCKEDGREYVMKIQSKERLRAEKEMFFRRGIERLMNMKANEHVVQILECFEDAHYFYTVQEACDGGSLSDFADLLDAEELDQATLEDEVRQVMHELLVALDHMHKQGLIHKDVKLENLVFKNKGPLRPRVPVLSTSPVSGRVSGLSRRPTLLKLIDFDSTEEFNEEYKRRMCKIVLGSDGYIAPEAYEGYCTPKSDVFSAGVIMYALMSGSLPYDDAIFDDAPGENYIGSLAMKKIHAKLRKTKVRYGKKWTDSWQAKSFCKALLEHNYAERPTAEEALKHPWMVTYALEQRCLKASSGRSVSF